MHYNIVSTKSENFFDNFFAETSASSVEMQKGNSGKNSIESKICTQKNVYKRAA